MLNSLTVSRNGDHLLGSAISVTKHILASDSSAMWPYYHSNAPTPKIITFYVAV